MQQLQPLGRRSTHHRTSAAELLRAARSAVETNRCVAWRSSSTLSMGLLWMTAALTLQWNQQPPSPRHPLPPRSPSPLRTEPVSMAFSNPSSKIAYPEVLASDPVL